MSLRGNAASLQGLLPLESTRCEVAARTLLPQRISRSEVRRRCYARSWFVASWWADSLHSAFSYVVALRVRMLSLAQHCPQVIESVRLSKRLPVEVPNFFLGDRISGRENDGGVSTQRHNPMCQFNT